MRSLLGICAAFLLLSAACKKEKSTIPGICATGYEGSDCKTQIREKFEGNWFQAGKTTGGGTSQYLISVVKVDEITSVVIQNFDNIPAIVKAHVSHSDSLIIPDQGIPGKRVVGFCHYISEHNVVIHYDITDSVTHVVSSMNTVWR